MNATHLHRLYRLARHLMTRVTPKNFDMSYWYCGTAGCAVGHACMMPEFQRVGLKTIKIPAENISRPSVQMPKYRGVAGWPSVREFFGLNPADSTELFSHDSYNGEVHTITPKRVAKRINGFVRKHVKLLLRSGENVTPDDRRKLRRLRDQLVTR
jgi:hypothetical protein